MAEVRQVEISLLQKSLEGNGLAMQGIKRDIQQILSERYLLKDYLIKKLPAIYDKVRLNSIASGKAEMLKPQVALDQPLEVSKDRKLNRYLSANTAA